MITGANSGIGREAAIRLAAKGAHVVAVCRNADRGRKAVEEIRSVSGNPSVDLMLADLSSLASVRRLALDFTAKFGRLDVLINNAGARFGKRIITADGYEQTFTVHYLAPFLLTLLLKDALIKSAPARVINVSSGAQSMGHIDFENLMGEIHYNGTDAYCRAKLALVMFTLGLAERWKDKGVVVNVLHPGVVKTQFMKNASGLYAIVGTIMVALKGISAEEGAETTIYLASSQEVAGVTGKFFHFKNSISHNPEADDIVIRDRLWNMSERITGITA